MISVVTCHSLKDLSAIHSLYSIILAIIQSTNQVVAEQCIQTSEDLGVPCTATNKMQKKFIIVTVTWLLVPKWH